MKGYFILQSIYHNLARNRKKINAYITINSFDKIADIKTGRLC